jgi:hypothetical protein
VAAQYTTTILLLARLRHRRQVCEPFFVRWQLCSALCLLPPGRLPTCYGIIKSGYPSSMQEWNRSPCGSPWMLLRNANGQTVGEDRRRTLRSLVAQLVPCWTRTLPYWRWQAEVKAGKDTHGNLDRRPRRRSNYGGQIRATARRLVSASAVNTPTKPRLMVRPYPVVLPRKAQAPAQSWVTAL